MNTTGRGCFRSGDLRQVICQRQGSAVMSKNWALKRRARTVPNGGNSAATEQVSRRLGSSRANDTTLHRSDVKEHS